MGLPPRLGSGSQAAALDRPEDDVNRATRRAIQQGKVRQEFFRIAFSRDEASIIEEALELYGRQLAEDVDGNPTPVQEWAINRAEKIRGALLAAIEDRPWVDDGDREFVGPAGEDPPAEARPAGSSAHAGPPGS
jgi:hypothetical protein